MDTSIYDDDMLWIIGWMGMNIPRTGRLVQMGMAEHKGPKMEGFLG